jgi:hypothetical protein
VYCDSVTLEKKRRRQRVGLRAVLHVSVALEEKRKRQRVCTADSNI